MKRLNAVVMAVALIMCTACAGQGTQEEKTSSSEQGGVIDMEQGEGIARIPDVPLQIPDDYYSPAEEQGTLECLEYTTYESFSYEERTKQLTKTAYVYLPYGYSEDKQYNVFYLMHG